MHNREGVHTLMIKEFITYFLNTTNAINNRIFNKLGFMLITVFIITGVSVTSAEAASSFKIYNYNTKHTTTYTGKQVKVTCNGSTISKTSTPGILINGVSMQPYDDIFKNSRIAADCSYDSKKGTITISKYNTKIVMKIGSKIASVNGKSFTLAVAPIKIKYVAANQDKVLVPSGFISRTLGLGYTWYSDKSTVAIVKSTILISINNGLKYEYSGAQVNTTIDNKKVNLTTMPNIISNGTAMLRAVAVFADSSIDAKYSFESKTKQITITKGKQILKMTIGSKTFYLNNVKKSLPTAPILLTNHETNCTYVMVPGSFTATSLGYKYHWDNKTRTSEIASKSTQGDPELGDSGDITDTGVILNEWIAKEKNYEVTTGVHSLSSNISSSTKVGMLNNIYIDKKDVKPNRETFIFATSTTFGKITSSNNGKRITIQAYNTKSSNKTEHFKEDDSKLLSNIKTTNKSANSSTTIELNLRQEYYQYDVSFSANKKLLLVTVYTNSIISALIGSNDEGEYLVMNGVNILHASVSESDNKITIEFPDCVSGIGDILEEVKSAKYIKKIYSVSTADKTKIFLDMKEGYVYSTKQVGKQFQLIIQASSIPFVKDKSKYEIVIPLSSGINSLMISDEDFYYKNYFVIRIQGDNKNYYKNHAITENSKNVTSVTTSLNGSGDTEFKINTTKIQGYELAIDSKNLYINVGNPKEIYKNIVVLDPGHGGSAVGAKNKGYYEKDINFKILYTVGKKYFNQDPLALKVYYTRTSDFDISLEDRAAFASKVGADLFVSLHMNSAANAPNAKGTEVFYSAHNNDPNKAGLTSKTLASSLVNNLAKALGSSNRGVKEDGFLVIKRNTVPAVLIELGFISNTTDLSMMTNTKKQETAAQTIYKTLLDVFEKYPS